MLETKSCKWCSGVITRKRHSKSEWSKVDTCSVKCAALFRWNQCSEKDMKVLPDRFCRGCRAVLVRGESEKRQAWEKREYCNKSCARTGKSTKKQFFVPVGGNENNMGVKRYIPGTPEFDRIAAQYM